MSGLRWKLSLAIGAVALFAFLTFANFVPESRRIESIPGPARFLLCGPQGPCASGRKPWNLVSWPEFF